MAQRAIRRFMGLSVLARALWLLAAIQAAALLLRLFQ
jgi:hypothetical protein